MKCVANDEPITEQSLEEFINNLSDQKGRSQRGRKIYKSTKQTDDFIQGPRIGMRRSLSGSDVGQWTVENIDVRFNSIFSGNERISWMK